MFPMLLASLVGAAGSTIGGIMGANAQEDANDKNWKINLLNYYQRERERNDRIQAAKRAETMQNEGATDAQGNRVRYVPGKGWVTELSSQGKELDEAQRNEQFAGLQDARTKRQQIYKNLSRQGDEGYAADALLERMKDTRVDPEELKRTTYGEASKGINRGYDDATNTAMRKAIRTGSSNTGSILAAFAKSRSGDLANAYTAASQGSRDKAQQMTDANVGNLLNRYNMLATRASTVPGTNYQPQNIQGNSDNLLRSFAGRSDQGLMSTIGAAGNKGGEVDYVTGNTGYGNAVAGGAQAFAGGLSNIGAQSQRNDMLNYYRDRLGSSKDWGSAG